jgi:hypothetical protein
MIPYKRKKDKKKPKTPKKKKDAASEERNVLKRYPLPDPDPMP